MAIFGSFSSLKSELMRLIHNPDVLNYIEDALKKDSKVNRRIKALKIGEYSQVKLTCGTNVIEQHYMTKSLHDGFYESHKKFIDVQVVIEGDETILVKNINRLIAEGDYNEENDFIIYEFSEGYSSLRCYSEDLAIFAPEDGHMPGISSTEKHKEVYKAVIKIPV